MGKKYRRNKINKLSLELVFITLHLPQHFIELYTNEEKQGLSLNLHNFEPLHLNWFKIDKCKHISCHNQFKQNCYRSIYPHNYVWAKLFISGQCIMDVTIDSQNNLVEERRFWNLIWEIQMEYFIQHVKNTVCLNEHFSDWKSGGLRVVLEKRIFFSKFFLKNNIHIK